VKQHFISTKITPPKLCFDFVDLDTFSPVSEKPHSASSSGSYFEFILEKRLNSISQPSQESNSVQKKYHCDVCPKSFTRNHDLKRHYRKHLGVKPFVCTSCSKSFTRSDEYKRHVDGNLCFSLPSPLSSC
jgi:uncharacterized Zn-finger protein